MRWAWLARSIHAVHDTETPPFLVHVHSDIYAQRGKGTKLVLPQSHRRPPMNDQSLELPVLSPSILVGDPSIDIEHHAIHAFLIRWIRILEETESLPESNEFIDAVIRLGELIYMHARNEELILATTSMPEPEVKRHQAAHTQIIEQFADLSFKLLEGERMTRVEILRLIRRTIIEHHIEYDLKISAYIEPSAWWHGREP
jgi:hemerythrin